MIKKGNLYYPSKDFQKKAIINNPSIYKKAERNPVKFWEDLAKELFWFKKWKKGFVHNPPYFEWFKGGKINITSNIFENNPLGFDKIKNKAALIWEPEPIEERPRILTYYELFREVNRLANGLKDLGVKKGDRVGIYLPMIPEAIISMLACARIGAVHAVVFSAFSPHALQVRLQDTQAKVLITADGYYRRGKIIDLKKNADRGTKNTKVKKVIVVNRTDDKAYPVKWNKGKDIWYEDLTKNQKDYCKPEIMDSEDIFFILYTSGSTGKPKGCIHTCGGYTVQAKFTAKWIFDLKQDDIFWSTADLGWVTGHTYSCYGPLLNGTTFIMFEGAPNWPVPDRWGQIIEKYGVTTFYTAPTAIRMFQKYGTDLLKKYKFETLQILGSVGEPIDEAAWKWYFKEIGKNKCPLVDTWWQTETGGILITCLPGIGPFKPSFTGLPFPGIKFEILNKKGEKCKTGEHGNLIMLPPFCPGLLRGVYKNPKKYLDTYWKEYGKEIYFTSDGALKDKNGLIRIIGRIDDVIKVAGHRVTTGELESAITKLHFITECAVIGIPDEIRGEIPVVFIISKNKIKDIEKQVISQIRKEIGPIALPKKIYSVSDLPKTRSGKIMRRILKKLFSKEPLGDLSTLANPETVEQIKKVIIDK
ncbi:acetate--CoA ligase [Candidatus Parcubacteria bacterium]|nr:acetate--CoA ligase [Candidatus Parcubacteria bacterium]